MASSQPAPGVIPKSSFAPLGRRIAAYVIDVTITFAVLLAATLAIRWLRIVGVWTPAEGVDAVGSWALLETPAKVAVIIAFLVSMGPIYLALFEASAWQASIGKRLMNVYVTDQAGRRVGFARSIGRSFAKAIFTFFQVGFLSLFTILISDKKQSLHDFAAKTLVVRGKPITGEALEMWRCIAAFGATFLWLVVTFVAAFRTIPQK